MKDGCASFARGQRENEEMTMSEPAQPIIQCFLLPGIGVGPFRYGDDESMVLELFDLELFPDVCGPNPWRTYNVPGQRIQLYFDEEEGVGITGVGCFDHLLFRGRDIVALRLDEIRSFLGKEDKMEKEIAGRTPLEFELLGLQIWLGQDGCCDSVMCSTILDE